MKVSYETLKFELREQVAWVTFNREKDTNAFSRRMTEELMAVCRELELDGQRAQPEVSALVLTGGIGRSFSVGGDFHDVGMLCEEKQIRSYLGEIIDSYISVLSVDVPVIAAIDRFAIGQGLQVALMSDFRVGTEACQLQMPELKNGVACPLGSVILEFLFGRAKMLEFVMDCEFIRAPESRAHGLLNQLCDSKDLLTRAGALADKFKAYPRASFVTTKRIQNQRFIAALEGIREASSQAHVAAFMQRSGQKHFDKVLGRAS
jgi:carboxymethylproline synthase